MIRASRLRLEPLLHAVERAGNALPHPATLFFLLAIGVVLVSALAAGFGLTVTHPGTGRTVEAVNLLSLDGLHRILTSLVTNFTGFAPLGTVLVAMLGIGVAEGSGLIAACLKLLVSSAPRRLLTFAIVLAGVLSNTASEIGYVLLVPLAATIFAGIGRHPLAGLAAAFAGVSGGYSANLLLGTIDPLLAGLTEEAARIIDPAYRVSPACNYYFMSASTLLIALAGTWVTERIVGPRLGPYAERQAATVTALSASERRGLRFALAAAVAFLLLLGWGTIPATGFLRNPETGSLLHSPFLSGIVAFIFLGGVTIGGAYGFGAGTIRNDAQLAKAMGKALETLGGYLVLVFFAAQFVALFNWSNLGLIVAIEGAAVLKALGLGGVPLMVGLVTVAAGINLFMGSASAKWAILAPVFVPMFMLLGYTPEFTQAAYRIGDSVTNVISPMMSYFALIISFVDRWKKGAGIGTLVSLMLPYSAVFFAVWVALLVVWMLAGLPVGPGAGLYLNR
jgi:aminobenzoyl-glutamate transport protein